MDYKYHECIRNLVIDMEMRGMHVGSFRSIFDHIYYVSLYQKRFYESSTPESEALARWNLKDANDNLEHIMQKLGFNDSLKEDIRYIAKSPLSCVKL